MVRALEKHLANGFKTANELRDELRKSKEKEIWHQAIRAAATSQAASADGRWREGKHNQAHSEKAQVKQDKLASIVARHQSRS